MVVVAIGSTPTKPNMPGMDGTNVHYASQIYGTMEDRLAEEIVMIGGGEIGVETALYLCELGKKVTVLEMLPELIADALMRTIRIWCTITGAISLISTSSAV